MKLSKIVLLLGALVCTHANAETIDSYAAVGSPGAVNTTTTVCVKIPFIKRNSGTLVTGLTTAKLKPFEAVELVGSATGVVKRSFTFAYSLTAITPAGVYHLCLKPTGAGMVWRRPGVVSYLVGGIILGTTAADNGLFSVTLQ